MVADGPSGNQILTAALEWWDAGASLIPIRADGTKRPLIAWKRNILQRAYRSDLEGWFGYDPHLGLGLICGAVSGGIEMLELEGRAATPENLDKIEAECTERGVAHVWVDLGSASYAEWTPSGGLHLIYATDGSWVVPGNTKIANNAAKECLAETRGEGGYVIVAPSGGNVHATGESWTKIAGSPADLLALSSDQRRLLHEAIHAALDETPPEPVRPPVDVRPLMPTPWLPADGERPGDEFNRRADWASILEPQGWTRSHSVGAEDFWTRPGKEVRDGISASTGYRAGVDCLFVWSSSTGLPTEKPLSKLFVHAHYNHGGDMSAAASALRREGFGSQSSTGGVDPWLGATPYAPHLWAQVGINPHPSPGADIWITPDGWEAKPAPAAEPPDDTFWNARPYLKHIRDAAHSRQRSADAVLGVVLARTAAMTDHRIRIPAIVGSPAGLSLISMLVGPSGVGKSTTAGIGAELLPVPDGLDMLEDQPLGSGEGMAEIFYGMVKEADPVSGKDVAVRRMVRHNAMFTVDEGAALTEMSKRQGSTMMTTLRSAWSNQTLGAYNAATENRRIIPAGSYNMGIVVGIQQKTAGPLFAEAAGGTPQRLLWFPVVDDNVPDIDDQPAWPGRLPWRPPSITRLTGLLNEDSTAGVVVEGELKIAAPIVREIKLADLARVRGEVQAEELDSHEGLVRLKVAALLAILDGRLDVNEEDWALALAVQQRSKVVRDRTRAIIAHEEQARLSGSALAKARLEAQAADIIGEGRVQQCARAIVAVVSKTPDAWTRRLLQQRMTRYAEVFADAVDLATEVGYIHEEAVKGERGPVKRWIRLGKGEDRVGSDGVGTLPGGGPGDGAAAGVEPAGVQSGGRGVAAPHRGAGVGPDGFSYVPDRGVPVGVDGSSNGHRPNGGIAHTGEVIII